jgi:hypothetical protein
MPPLASAATVTVYVQPSQSRGGGPAAADDGGGFFRSLADVQSWLAARSRRELSDTVVVRLAAGEHLLLDSKPLSLTPAVVGRAAGVLFRGPEPGASGGGTEPPALISGAIALPVWTPLAQGLASSTVPCGTVSRRLTRDDRQVPRARSAGEFRVFDGTVTATTTGYLAADTRMADWATVAGVEFVYPRTLSNGTNLYKSFTESRVGVAAVEKTAEGMLNVTMRQPAWSRLIHRLRSPARIGAPVRAEGAAELLGEGQWYLDADRCRVLYRGDPAGAEWRLAVAPRLLEMTAVSNVRFERVTFAHSTWLGPDGSDGLVEDQGGNHFISCPEGDCTYAQGAAAVNDTAPFYSTPIPAAVAVHGCTDIEFLNCAFKHIGSTALAFDTQGGLPQPGPMVAGTQRAAVAGCSFTDISCSAVQLGIFGDTDAPFARQNRELSVTDSVVRQTPSEFSGCAGLIAGYVANSSISHNDLQGLSNTGIALGWGWGVAASWAELNHIDFNRIDRANQVLADGGSLYTLSPQPGSTVHSNFISNQRLRDSPLYHDEGSGGFHTHHNVIYQSTHPPEDCSAHNSSCQWLHVNPGSRDIQIDHIYANQPTGNDLNTTSNISNVTLDDIYIVNGSAFPAAARAIMESSGVRT